MLLLGFSRFGGKNKEIKYNRRKSSAFTLAEVLITLGIIGVVAAMTLPTLVQKYEEKAAVTALKKFYSASQQAYQFAVAEHGTPDTWGFTSSDSEKFISYIAPYMKFTKICTTGEKCHPNNIYLRSGTKQGNIVFNPIDKTRWAAQLADGMIIGTFVYSEEGCTSTPGTSKQLTNVCGEYTVDINGGKKPNQYGKDIFIFYLTKYGVIPTGTVNQKPQQKDFKNTCLSKSATGYGCTAWVIYNENMDYFHCDDLSWDGKTKCK